MKGSHNKVIDFSEDLSVIERDLKKVTNSLTDNLDADNEQRQQLNDLIRRANSLMEKLPTNSTASNLEPLETLDMLALENLNLNIDSLMNVQYQEEQVRKFPKLSHMDCIIAIVAGTLAIAIDVLLVGTPEVVKLYRGGENFDGSYLTGLIRKLGNSDLSKTIGNRLSKMCKVPYDIPLIQVDGVTPDNHRLKSLAHDPFIGLFFAIADILMGTTTYIDKLGHLKIAVNEKFIVPLEQKFFSVFYFIGHILSDFCTPRGIPIPGFFLTQFFTNDNGQSSIAKIAESMYRDGYDLRHLISMSFPVAVNHMVINIYLRFSETTSDTFALPIAEKERIKLNFNLKKDKMHFVANSIAAGGNAVKFIATSGNFASINLPEWCALLRSSIRMFHGLTRDTSTEKAMDNRKHIDEMWKSLLSEF